MAREITDRTRLGPGERRKRLKKSVPKDASGSWPTIQRGGPRKGGHGRRLRLRAVPTGPTDKKRATLGLVSIRGAVSFSITNSAVGERNAFQAERLSKKRRSSWLSLGGDKS